MTRYLLLHAFPFDGSLWDDVAEILRARGHEVLTPDLRGFGSAETGDDAPDIDHMVSDVLPLLAGEPAVVAGCSMGGYVALGIARRHPELVSALALIDTKATADGEHARAHRGAVAALAETGGEWSTGMIDGLLGVTTRSTRPDLVERVTHTLAQANGASVAWAQRAMAQRPDSRDVLAQLAAPVLAVMGEEDAMSPLAEQQIIIESAQQARLVLIPASGHLSPVEAPVQVADALLSLAAIRY